MLQAPNHQDENDWCAQFDVTGMLARMGNSSPEQHLQPMPSSLRANVDQNQDYARQVASSVEQEFVAKSQLYNPNRSISIPVFDGEEVILEGDVLHKGKFCTIAPLRCISMRYGIRNPPFDEAMHLCREGYAARSHDGHYVLKCCSQEVLEQDKDTVHATVGGFVLEAQILMNLAAHPNICRLYGMSAVEVANAEYGCKVLEDGFFLIVDRINESLPQRMEQWRQKKAYEGERLDDLAARQSQITQRLEVALEICSALVFLSNRKLIYHLHPTKVGFDSKYNRIKLFDFRQAQEENSSFMKKIVFSSLRDTGCMTRRAYFCPEILSENQQVTCKADVYAFGMLVWELLSLRSPLHGMSTSSHLTKVIQGGKRPPLNKTWPQNLRAIIGTCWSDFENRSTMQEIYDSLEKILLNYDLNGIDSTEDPLNRRNDPIASEAPSERLKYQSTLPTMDEHGGQQVLRQTKSANDVSAYDQSIRSMPETSARIRSSKTSDDKQESTAPEKRALRRSRSKRTGLIQEKPSQESSISGNEISSKSDSAIRVPQTSISFKDRANSKRSLTQHESSDKSKEKPKRLVKSTSNREVPSEGSKPQRDTKTSKTGPLDNSKQKASSKVSQGTKGGPSRSELIIQLLAAPNLAGDNGSTSTKQFYSSNHLVNASESVGKPILPELPMILVGGHQMVNGAPIRRTHSSRKSGHDRRRGARRSSYSERSTSETSSLRSSDFERTEPNEDSLIPDTSASSHADGRAAQKPLRRKRREDSNGRGETPTLLGSLEACGKIPEQVSLQDANESISLLAEPNKQDSSSRRSRSQSQHRRTMSSSRSPSRREVMRSAREEIFNSPRQGRSPRRSRSVSRAKRSLSRSTSPSRRAEAYNNSRGNGDGKVLDRRLVASMHSPSGRRSTCSRSPVSRSRYKYSRSLSPAGHYRRSTDNQNNFPQNRSDHRSNDDSNSSHAPGRRSQRRRSSTRSVSPGRKSEHQDRSSAMVDGSILLARLSRSQHNGSYASSVSPSRRRDRRLLRAKKGQESTGLYPGKNDLELPKWLERKINQVAKHKPDDNNGNENVVSRGQSSKAFPGSNNNSQHKTFQVQKSRQADSKAKNSGDGSGHGVVLKNEKRQVPTRSTSMFDRKTQRKNRTLDSSNDSSRESKERKMGNGSDRPAVQAPRRAKSLGQGLRSGSSHGQFDSGTSSKQNLRFAPSQGQVDSGTSTKPKQRTRDTKQNPNEDEDANIRPNGKKHFVKRSSSFQPGPKCKSSSHHCERNRSKSGNEDRFFHLGENDNFDLIPFQLLVDDEEDSLNTALISDTNNGKIPPQRTKSLGREVPRRKVMQVKSLKSDVSRQERSLKVRESQDPKIYHDKPRDQEYSEEGQILLLNHIY